MCTLYFRRQTRVYSYGVPGATPRSSVRGTVSRSLMEQTVTTLDMYAQFDLTTLSLVPRTFVIHLSDIFLLFAFGLWINGI